MLLDDPDAEAGERLSNAYEKVRRAWESTPPIRELSSSHAVSNIWPALTLSYSGMEQALKLLLARDRGISVRQLIELPATASRALRRRFNNHDLSWLFGQLEDGVRDAVDAEFRTFLSLYSFIPHESLSDFLADISGDNGDGYARWRYVLVELDSGPPRNSPDAMLAALRCLLLELSRQSEWDADFGPLHQEIDDERAPRPGARPHANGHATHP